jgi:hypothetical protein
MPTELLVVSHLCKDLGPPPGHERIGWRPGGSAYYVSRAARKLGLKVAVVTSAGPELDVGKLLGSIPHHCAPSSTTTTFENIYSVRGRRQTVRDIATTLSWKHIPPRWRRPTAVLLAPVAGEINQGLLSGWGASLLCVCLQGWLRRWDRRGNVRHAPWKPPKLERPINVLFFSREDLDEEEERDEYAQHARVSICTEAEKGILVRTAPGEAWQRIPGIPARVKNVTGAGDIFAGAFLFQFLRTGDALASATFANAAGSFSVEHVGLRKFPSQSQVEEHLRQAQRPA